MVATAEGLNRVGPACRFVVNDAADLERFASGTFAFVYSSVVLQHLADAPAHHLVVVHEEDAHR